MIKLLLALMLSLSSLLAAESNDIAEYEDHRNDHVTVLDLSNDFSLVNIDFVKYFPNLRELDLSRSQINTVESLLFLPELRKLNLSYCQYIQDLEKLEHLKNLKELNIRGVWHSDNEGMKSYSLSLDFLASLKKLRKLDVSNNDLLSTIAPLAHLPQLKWLSVSYTAIDDLYNLSTVSSLRELHMAHVSNSSHHVPTAFLHDLPNLKKVTLDSRTRFFPLPSTIETEITE